MSPSSRLKSYARAKVRGVTRIFAEETARATEHRRGLDVEVNTERLAKILAAQVAQGMNSDELQSESRSQRLKLDIVDAIEQLASGIAKEPLRQYYSGNHRWVALLAERNRRAASTTYDFVDSEMQAAVFYLRQFDMVESKTEAINYLDGEILDLGVYRGGSTRALAHIFPDKIIHGFDSFEGLPEDWSYVLKGRFGDLQGALPEVPENVRLYKGWFDDTLPVWADEHPNSRISLLRIDCDIYSSTKTIFDSLGHLITSGTWILFDELIGYKGWQDHEYKAFQEFLEPTDLQVEYVAYGLTYALVRLS